MRIEHGSSKLYPANSKFWLIQRQIHVTRRSDTRHGNAPKERNGR